MPVLQLICAIFAGVFVWFFWRSRRIDEQCERERREHEQRVKRYGHERIEQLKRDRSSRIGGNRRN